MSAARYTEETLVQQTVADYLERRLGWESVYAHHTEDFGPGSLLGRASDREVVLERPLREALAALNPGLPAAAYDGAVRQVTGGSAAQTTVAANRENYELLRDGVPVAFRGDRGATVRRRLRLLDFDQPANNRSLCVRELWVRGDLYRRPDLIGFVNGLPLLFIECKNMHRDLKAAFEANYSDSDYRDTVSRPQRMESRARPRRAFGCESERRTACGTHVMSLETKATRRACRASACASNSSRG